jgi:hypothetical protein
MRTAKPVECIVIHMLEKPIQDAMEGSPAAEEWLMVSVGRPVDTGGLSVNLSHLGRQLLISL